MARVFPFILKTKHKTLHVKRAWAELENFAEKKSARASIDRSSLILNWLSQADLHSKSYRTLDSNFTYKHTLSKSKIKNKTFWSWFTNITNWSSNTFKPKVLEPNKFSLWQSVTKHKLKQNAQSYIKIAHYNIIAQHNKFNLTTIYRLQV